MLLRCTLSGRLLPPQVIYAGSTNQVHPKFSFPDGWHITHTQNHWSNSESMCDYTNNVIVPYVENVREHLPLSRGDVPALCIFDVFKAHQVSDFKELMTKNNIRMRYVPAGCTFELQPIDLSGNDEFKNHIKKRVFKLVCSGSSFRTYSTPCLHMLSPSLTHPAPGIALHPVRFDKHPYVA